MYIKSGVTFNIGHVAHIFHVKTLLRRNLKQMILVHKMLRYKIFFIYENSVRKKISSKREENKNAKELFCSVKNHILMN